LNSNLWFYVSVHTRYNVELGVTNLVQCFKFQKFGYKQTCCSLDVMYLKYGVKDHSDAVFQRPMCNVNYTTLKMACYSWRLKGGIPTPYKVQEYYMC